MHPVDLPTILRYLGKPSERRRDLLCSALLLLQTLVSTPNALAKETPPAQALRPGTWEHVEGDSTCAPTFKLLLKNNAAFVTDIFMCGKGRTVYAKAAYKVVQKHKDRVLLALKFSEIKEGHNAGRLRLRRKTSLGPYKNRVFIKKGVWLKVTMKAVCKDKKSLREICLRSKQGERCMILVASKRLVKTPKGYKNLRPTCVEDSLWLPGSAIFQDRK